MVRWRLLTAGGMDVTVCMGRGQGQGLGSAFGGVSRSEVGMGGVCSTGGSQTSTLVLDPFD
jgi:preprotein translocase subunit SecG